MRKVFQFPVILLLIMMQATFVSADQYDVLFEEFDARPLDNDEKRFLQAALAFQGFYTGLLDGKWGQGSQSAIARYASKDSELEPANYHMATLVMDFLENFENEGWKMRYLPSLAMSLALPEKSIGPQIRDEFGYDVWEHRYRTLDIMTARQDTAWMKSQHSLTFRNSSNHREPYTVRNADRWVTSAETPDRTMAYVRSELIGSQWSTILVISSIAEVNLLNTVAASITVGRGVDWTITDGGYLDRIVSLTFDYVDKENSSNSSDRPSSTERSPKSNAGATGTGFFVDSEGYLLTNAHVVEGCDRVEVGDELLHVVAVSDEYDLALLKLDATMDGFDVVHFAARPAKLNADITVVGYPLHGVLGGLNVTRGAVASLTGLGGDSTVMQISAPVQLGNSGGPVLDEFGTLAGVVVSKLDAQRVADAIGDMPQNINFAIRGEIAKLFLTTQGINYQISMPTEKVSPVSIAAKATKFTVLLECK